MNPVAAVAIVPAAGRAERFGGGKLLAKVRGEPLLNHTLRCLVDGGIDRVVLVTAPGASFSAVPLASDARVMIIENPDPSRGMFSSIQTGLEAAAADSPILVLPADMPFVAASTVSRVIARAAESGDDHVIVPTYAGRRGHPIVIPASLRARLLDADPRSSLRDALTALGVTIVLLDVDDDGVLRDVDVREDLDSSAR